MRTHRLSKITTHTPEQMFTLAGDVERYPEFVPWVAEMRVWNRQIGENGADSFDAEASVKFAVFRERFSTHVVRDPAALTVSTRLISGPFRHLVCDWTFKPHAQGCEIGFFIEFDFRSRFLEALLDANFDRAVGKLIGCFEQRADQLYGL